MKTVELNVEEYLYAFYEKVKEAYLGKHRN